MEPVDILAPPMFEPTGEQMTATEAILAGKWLGTANVWVYRFGVSGEIEFLYQEREPNSPWMPGKLDVAAGGYLKSGEAISAKARLGGARRELKDELNLEPEPSRLQHITRRLNVGISQKGNERKTCCDIYALEFADADAVAMREDAESGVLEVAAIYWIDLNKILQLHGDRGANATVRRVDHDGKAADVSITADNFCPNYDDYLFTMPAMIASVVSARRD